MPYARGDDCDDHGDAEQDGGPATTNATPVRSATHAVTRSRLTLSSDAEMRS